MKSLWLVSLACTAMLGGQVAPALSQPVSARSEWPSERPPRPLPATDANFPSYHMRTLPNGIQVVAVPHHEQPAVSLRLIVGAGSAADPEGKLGVANLTAQLLTQGTTSQSATELNDEVDFIGAAMGTGAGNDLTFIEMVVMQDSFERGLEILSDLARRPAFSQEEIDRQRQQLLSNLQVSFDDPGFIANAVFARLVYGFHPYGMPGSGTPESVGSISRDDVVEYHRRYFVPNNTIMAIVGDVTAEEAFAGAERVFGDWERAELPRRASVDPPEPTRRIVVVNMPGAVQTEVRVGHVGIRRDHDDYMRLNLATRILGGEGANRLHQVLRTERGLTYGAQADMHALREQGDFEASTSTRSEATGEVLRLMVDEFWRLQRERVNRRELAEAQAYMSGSFPLTIEVPDAIATQVLNVVFYGLPVEQLQSFRERVNRVTVDDIQRVAREYFRPDRLSIVLVGDAETFVPQLRGIGFGSYEVVERDELDLTSIDFKRRSSAPAGADATGRVPVERLRAGGTLAYQATSAVGSGTGMRATELVDRVIAAKGGYDTLSAIRTITAFTRAEMTTPAGPVLTETTTYLQYPDRVRVETKLPDADIVQVFDGRQAWVKDPNGVHEVPERLLPELTASFERDTIAALLAAKGGGLRARLLPDVIETGDGRQHVLELSSANTEPLVFYIDPETALVTKQAYVAGGPDRPLVEERFTDYRMVDGVQIAFTASISRGGQSVLERHVTEIRVNVPLDAALFGRPSS